MSSKLIPTNPSDVMVIRHVTPNVVTLSLPFLRFGTLKIGGRGTIGEHYPARREPLRTASLSHTDPTPTVRLTSGALAIFSPVALTPEVQATLASLGNNLQYIIATDIEHHIFISDWARAFPSARIIGPEGLPEKRSKSTDPMIGKEEFFTVFKAGKDKRQTKVAEDFDRDFEYEFVDAHPNKELVFLYKPDRVLIEADLMFNLPPTEQYSRVPEAEKKEGVLDRMFSALQSTAGEAKGQRRFIWHAMSRGDRKGFGESIKRIDGWDFTTVIPCHGDTIEGNGKEVFERVFAWHLKGE